MYRQKVLLVFVLIIYFLFVFFELGGQEDFAVYFKSLITPFIALMYFLFSKNKTLFFSLFISLFAVSDFLQIIDLQIPFEFNYYLGNTLYILAYLLLSIEIYKSMCFVYIIKNFKIRLTVLMLLNLFLLYFLHEIVSEGLTLSQLYYELIYNIVMLMLLSLSFLNYFFRDNIKSFYLFIGVLLCVLSEVINVSNMYSIERHFLSVISITLSLISFYFLCKQTDFGDEEV